MKGDRVDHDVSPVATKTEAPRMGQANLPLAHGSFDVDVTSIILPPKPDRRVGTDETPTREHSENSVNHTMKDEQSV